MDPMIMGENDQSRDAHSVGHICAICQKLCSYSFTSCVMMSKQVCLVPKDLFPNVHNFFIFFQPVQPVTKQHFQPVMVMFLFQSVLNDCINANGYSWGICPLFVANQPCVPIAGSPAVKSKWIFVRRTRRAQMH